MLHSTRRITLPSLGDGVPTVDNDTWSSRQSAPLRRTAPVRTMASSSSSSTSIPWLTDSVRDSVKESLLDQAARHDSPLWNDHDREEQGTTGPQHSSFTNSNAAANTHYVNGHSHATIQEEDSVSQHINDPIGSDATLAFTTHDPLNDLYLKNWQPQYWPHLPPTVQPLSDHNSPFVLARSELDQLATNIQRDLIGTDHPVLNQAAAYFFQSTDGGKKVRPLMVILLSRALAEFTKQHDTPTESIAKDDQTLFSAPFVWQRSDLPAAQRRLAEISEMIHTASLFHDDVIDNADTRRNAPTVHKVFGNKMAILAGDYLLARASIYLARLRNVQVVETMSTIIEHLVRGEVMQMKGTSGNVHHNDIDDDEQHNDQHIIYYLRKNFYKTGSLMANSCKSAALLGNYPPELVTASYRYGKHVGMAFQLVDDVLDFEGTLSQLGKPSLADLKAGLVTAPVLFAAQEFPTELPPMMDRKFAEPGDVDRTVELVFASKGLEKTKQLARVHAELAMEALLDNLPVTSTNASAQIYRDALVHLASKVVSRTK